MKVSDCCWITASAVTHCVFFFISWLPKFNVQPLNWRKHMQVTFIFRMRDISKGKIQVLKKRRGAYAWFTHFCFYFIADFSFLYLSFFFHYAYHWLKNSFCFHLLVVNILLQQSNYSIYLFFLCVWGGGDGLFTLLTDFSIRPLRRETKPCLFSDMIFSSSFINFCTHMDLFVAVCPVVYSLLIRAQFLQVRAGVWDCPRSTNAAELCQHVWK